MSMTSISTIAAGPLATAIIERRQLTAALDAVSRIVEGANKIPILGNVRVRAAGADHIALITTDLDIEIEVLVQVEAVDSRLDITVPCRKLTELSKKAVPGATLVTISGAVNPPTNNEARCTVRFNATEYNLAGMVAADFPELAQPDQKKRTVSAFTMTGTSLWSALDKLRGAISTEETRYYLNGIYIHRLRDDIVFAATDGHRLYVQDYAAPAGTDKLVGGIVPRKTVGLIHGLTKGKACPDAFSIEMCETRIVCRFDNVTIRSRLIDGTFPDYHRVMPTQNDQLADFDSAEMIDAVKSVVLIARTASHPMRIAFEDGACVLTVSTGEDKASAPLPGKIASRDMDLGVNAKYLMEAIDTACPGGERVFFEFLDPGAPMLVRGTSPRFRIALIPTRV